MTTLTQILRVTAYARHCVVCALRVAAQFDIQSLGIQSSRVVRLRGAVALTALTLALACVGSNAHAQFLMTLPADPIVLNAATGGTATFTATLTNNYAFDLYLNSDAFTIFNPATLDDTLFQNYFVPSTGTQPTLTANGGQITLSLFTVSLPAMTMLGIYSGTITLQGGAGPLDGADLATAQFAVSAASTAVPEPNNLALMIGMTGIAGAFAAQSARRKA